MSKLIRLDEDHFAYLVDAMIERPQAQAISEMFTEAWPGRKLLIMVADEFIDLTGQYEIVPIKDGEPTKHLFFGVNGRPVDARAQATRTHDL